MALRFLLVSLVVSMGFEMPSNADVASWTRSGRDWVDARVADLSGLRAGAERTLSGVVGGEPIPEGIAIARDLTGSSDLAFEVVSEGMAADFAVDLAITRSEEPAPAAGSAMLADLDRPAALPSGEPVDGLLAREGPPAGESPARSRLARLSDAVRLTREAVHAWAVLIQPAEAVATR